MVDFNENDELLEGLQFRAKKAVLSASGGLDSTMLLMSLLADGVEEVRCLSFDYGQNHKVEMKKLKKNIRFLNDKGFNVSHEIINLQQVFAGGTCSLTGMQDVPEGNYNDESMKSTVVPNRNIVFSSIIYARALSWANETGENVYIATGIHAGDHCFPKDTKIMTPYGFKDIETLNIGDEVYSMDPVNKCIELDVCTNKMKTGTATSLYKINTTIGSIQLTPDHKVYCMEFGEMTCSEYKKEIISKKASELNVGDILISPYKLHNSIREEKDGLVRIGDGAMIKISSIEEIQTNEDVYDITVEKNHNFFAGEYGNILIHNCIYPDCRPESQSMARELFKISNWGSEKVDYIAPFVNISKGDVLLNGLESMKSLGFSKTEMKRVLKYTHTCYKPNDKGEACGKCGSCTERLESFEYVRNIKGWKWLKSDPAKYIE